MAPQLLSALFALLLKVYFGKVRVVGRSRIPSTGPLLIVANHVNSLLDPLLLFAALPRPPRFLAKAPLFRHPLVAPFLRALRALPVHRRQDGEGTAGNAATFEACEHALLDGECVALFPEGLSHNEPKLQPLKTGAARIAGRAFSRGAAVQVVPVGLLFTARAVFRSQVTVVVGTPLTLGDLKWADGEDPEAVRGMTARIADALTEVTANADRWEDFRLVESLQGLALEGAGLAPEPRDPARTQQVLLTRFQEMRMDHPVEMAALLKRARNYARLLEAAGLTDREVTLPQDLNRALRRTGRSLLWLSVGWLPAFYGWVFHAIPYTFTGLAGKYLSRNEDVASTMKLYAGMMAYPATYALQLGLLYAALGLPWALGAGLAAPFCGFWALHYYAERDAFAQRAWAFLALRNQRRLAGRLRHLREETLAALEPLVALYR